MASSLGVRFVITYLNSSIFIPAGAGQTPTTLGLDLLRSYPELTLAVSSRRQAVSPNVLYTVLIFEINAKTLSESIDSASWSILTRDSNNTRPRRSTAI